MSSLAKVSVVIPYYNNANTIIQTLQSVLNQNYKFIEIIIVDDGSKDKTYEILVEFIKTYSIKNLQIIKQENQGPSLARNNGANHASGKYLVFIDADDYIDCRYIEKCISIIDNHSEIEIIYSDVEFFGSKNGKWKLADYKISSFLTGNCIPIFAMIKTDTFLEVGGFDQNLKYTEDFELWIKIIKKYGNCVYKIQEILYYYRKSEEMTSITDNEDEDDLVGKSFLYIYNKHYDFYKQNNLDIINLLLTFKYKNKYKNLWYKKIFKKLLNK